MKYTPEAPLLFLDFDGVVSRGDTADFARLPLLSEWVKDRPSLQVVISSAWRLYHSVPELVGLLHEPVFGASVVGERIVGVTGKSAGVDEGCERELLVSQWRQDHGHAGRFAALDDTAALFSPGWPHLVLTNGETGVTTADLRRLSGLLGV